MMTREPMTKAQLAQRRRRWGSVPGVAIRPDGRYLLRVTSTRTDGRRIERTRTLPATSSPAEVERVLAELKRATRATAHGMFEQTSRTPANTTVADFAIDWVAQGSERWTVKTTERYASAVTDVWLPELGEWSIARLSRMVVADAVRRVERRRRPDGQPYARATVFGWCRVLKTLLRDLGVSYGCEDLVRAVRPNPGHVPGRRTTDTLDLASVDGLCEAAWQVVEPRAPEIVVLARTGLRAGELYGLHWDDVALDEATESAVLTICKSATLGQIGETKTKSSRVVPGGPEVFHALRRVAEGTGREGLVFPSAKGGPRHYQSLTKPLKRAASAAGIEQHVTPQVLRRSWNTILLTQGVPAEVVRDMVGHCSEAMTQLYTSVPTTEKQRWLAKVAKGSSRTGVGVDVGVAPDRGAPGRTHEVPVAKCL